VRLPKIVIRPSAGVDSSIDRRTARQIAANVVADLPRRRLPIAHLRRITLWLETGPGQGAVVIAILDGVAPGAGPGRSRLTVELTLSRSGYAIGRVRR
jgi:hypothetical protein